MHLWTDLESKVDGEGSVVSDQPSSEKQKEIITKKS